jgi:hypothetical protein
MARCEATRVPLADPQDSWRSRPWSSARSGSRRLDADRDHQLPANGRDPAMHDAMSGMRARPAFVRNSDACPRSGRTPDKAGFAPFSSLVEDYDAIWVQPIGIDIQARDSLNIDPTLACESFVLVQVTRVAPPSPEASRRQLDGAVAEDLDEVPTELRQASSAGAIGSWSRVQIEGAS